MIFRKGHGSFHSASTTPAIITLELRQVIRLALVALNRKRTFGDRYQALGMILDRMEEIDKRFCDCHYDQIPEGLPKKSYEELTGTQPYAKAAGAGQ